MHELMKTCSLCALKVFYPLKMIIFIWITGNIYTECSGLYFLQQTIMILKRTFYEKFTFSQLIRRHMSIWNSDQTINSEMRHPSFFWSVQVQKHVIQEAIQIPLSFLMKDINEALKTDLESVLWPSGGVLSHILFRAVRGLCACQAPAALRTTKLHTLSKAVEGIYVRKAFIFFTACTILK